jgi:hypothetical protein
MTHEPPCEIAVPALLPPTLRNILSGPGLTLSVRKPIDRVPAAAASEGQFS